MACDTVDSESTVPLETSSVRLLLSHLRALFTAKSLYTRRYFRTLIFQVILPVLLLCGAELYSKYVSAPKVHARWSNIIAAPPLIMTTALFGDGAESYLDVNGPRKDGDWPDRLISTFQHDPGVGVRCLPYTVDEFNPACYRPVDSTNNTFSYLGEDLNDVPYNINASCKCDENVGWTCTQDDYPINFLPTLISANTTDVIRDLSKRNLSEYRLITRFAKSLKNAHNIIGGWSFGHENVQASNETAKEERVKGLDDAIRELSSAAATLGLNSSLWMGNSTEFPDPFVGNITVKEVLDDILNNMDTKENIKVWFNNKIWPSLPMYYNAISNAILRSYAKDIPDMASKMHDIGIVTFNHPMNRTAEDSLDLGQIMRLVMFRIVLLVFVFSIVPAGFASFLVTDRESHSMHLQLVSGLKRKTYWTVEYIFDFMVFALTSLLVLALYAIIGVQEMTRDTACTLSFFTLFLVYGLTALWLVILLQRLFAVPSLAFIVIAIGTFFVGIVCTMTVFMIESLLSNDETLQSAFDWTSIIFAIFVPQYNFGMAIYRGTYVYQVLQVAIMYLKSLNRADLIKQIPVPSILEWDLMGKHVFALFCQSIFLFLVVCFVEYGSMSVQRRVERVRTAHAVEKARKEEDVDVEMERERVGLIRDDAEAPENTQGLVIDDLAKLYGSHLAVKGVSFAVAPGECFGLLGLNGAGKTTTFGMLTGKHGIGHGQVRIRGSTVDGAGRSDGFRDLGYCPQFDALNMQLTTKEQLSFYARLRGVPEERIKHVVSSLLLSLHLRTYSDVLTANLSGGNRRKLSVAIALVSQPPVILLDEPSAGMDPGSQQFLWSVVGKLRRAGKAVVLTSHSMEECEALCTRIAIMDEGRIRCIGAKQHLKSKYGEGYTLTMKLPGSMEAEHAANVVLELIPQSKLGAIHCSTVFLHIPVGTCTVARLLNVVNQVKRQLAVEDFALTQTTLDDIFQSFSTDSVSASTSASSEALSAQQSTSRLQEEAVPSDPAPNPQIPHNESGAP